VRWLIVGDCSHEIYERSLVRGLVGNGIEAHAISYLSRHAPDAVLKAGQKQPNGCVSWLIERRLAKALRAYRPTHVLVWRGEPIAPRHLARLRRCVPSAVWCYYTNDFLFAPEDERRWSFVHRALPLYDSVFVYRELDRTMLAEASRVDARVWLPAYDPNLLGPEVSIAAADRRYDLVFVGHNEGDGRIDLLERLAASGVRMSLRGPGWPDIAGIDVGGPVYGKDYADAIRAARMALVLLSRRNRDEITRRCFEIPYVGTTMLSPRSPLMLSLFRENREALYFDASDEAVAQVGRHLRDPRRLDRISREARVRVDEVGGNIRARAAELIAAVS
jgi:spore maturation protein CgeB